jgi:hypothetical protein
MVRFGRHFSKIITGGANIADFANMSENFGQKTFGNIALPLYCFSGVDQ